jgi:outer membrane protein OmpA-like peptidoglycan-associated protein
MSAYPVIRLLAVAVAVAAVTAPALPAQGRAASAVGSRTVPLCAGLTIVTAIEQAQGDYESIKTVESIGDSVIRLKYSSERMVSDLFGDSRFERSTIYRGVLIEDLKSAKLYLQQFYSKLPETVPGTTAIGVSAAVLDALKTRGEAEIGIFIAFSGSEYPADRSVHPNVYDHQMVAKITRVGAGPVMVPVMVNDDLVELPALQARGDFFGDQSEFFFLDDPGNPLTLRFRVGIGRGPVIDSATARAIGVKPRPTGSDRDVLQVIKISHRCTGPEVAIGGPKSGGGDPPSGGGAASAGSLERALASGEKVEIYDIHFTFDSDRIREESEPRLAEIAEVLRRHPGWRLSVVGHTDNVASDAYNLDLSRRRAAAVKDALVKRYRIDPPRLLTGGYGESQPRDTNDTLEGRARNRRVELRRS